MRTFFPLLMGILGIESLLSIPTSSCAYASRFSSMQVDQIIQDNSLETIPQLVHALPEFLRTHLTFVFQSFSAQPSRLIWKEDDGEHSGIGAPRVIMWDSPGKFFLTYNGYENAPGYNTIETMDFIESSPVPSFRFGGKVFPDAHQKEFSSISERSCLGCHGTNPRPIWPEYPRWEGSYGSKEDILQPTELAQYQEFVALAKVNPLYQELFPSSAWTNFPYKKDSVISVMSESHTFKYRPNTRMGILLNRLNAIRILAILKSKPSFESDRSKLAFIFLGCGTSRDSWELMTNYALSARDLDMRYFYRDPRYTSLEFSDSYFDGASTTNELLAAAILKDLLKNPSPQLPDLKDLVTFMSLRTLYFSNWHRIHDAEFFETADELGEWVRTPFPDWQLRSKFRPRTKPAEAESVKRLCSILASTSSNETR